MNLDAFPFFIGGALLILALTGLFITFFTPVLNRWNKRYFICYFSILTLSITALIGDVAVYNKPDLMTLEIIILFFECFFISLMTVLPAIYLLHYSGKRLRSSAFFYVVAALWIIFFGLLLFSPLSDFIYSFSPDNRFLRGPGFWLFLLPLFLISIMTLIALIRNRTLLSRKMYLAILISLIPMSAGLILHMLIDAFFLIDISLSLSILTMFSLILSEQIDQFRLQQKEIARQQANILILQMRPHFIYNSLTSIYYLCEQNPKKAQEVIYEFTTYLRKNFTALSRETTISFTEELSHTRAYLAVEKALHEDLLYIDYDTPFTQFRIPPLTLQPIVENAIKHGLDPDADPLHISIQTRKTDSGTEIIVSNNGIGFNPDDDANPNSALSNIQQRLKLMCSGSITITSSKDSNTTVTVFIPS